MSAQVSEDFAAFTAPDPVKAAEAKKAEAAAKKGKKETMGQNAKVVDEMSEKAKEDKEAAEKSRLLTQIGDYVKHIKEYYPEREAYIKVPKNLSAKSTIQELKVYVKDLENELGKKGALDIVKGMWVKGLEFFEKVNEDERFGLNVTGLGHVARYSVAPRANPLGQNHPPLPGPAVPTLAEFSIKYASWFSSSVEARMVMMVFEMISGVHRMNTNQNINVQRASQTPVSQETDDLMNQL